jgi:hypothetical protein
LHSAPPCTQHALYARHAPPRAARALFRRSLADAQSYQARKPACCIKPRRAAIAAIHNNPHAGHRQRCLSDGGRQHHLALTIRGGGERAVLFSGRQFAMQWQHQRIQPAKPFCGAADFSPARQEGQYVARMRD